MVVDLIRNPSGRRSALVAAVWKGDLTLAKGDFGNAVEVETMGGDKTDFEIVELTGIVDTCSIETHCVCLPPKPPLGPVIAGIVPEPIEIGVDIVALALIVV